MISKYNLIEILIILLVNLANCQHGYPSTPQVVSVDRNWIVSENTTIGSFLKQATVGLHNDNVVFSLDSESSGQPGYNGNLPFRIDNETGMIFLNESLYGRAGEQISFYVYADIGEFSAKTEVVVEIISVSKNRNRHKPHYTPTVSDIRQTLPSINQYNTNPNRNPLFQNNYPDIPPNFNYNNNYNTNINHNNNRQKNTYVEHTTNTVVEHLNDENKKTVKLVPVSSSNLPKWNYPSHNSVVSTTQSINSSIITDETKQEQIHTTSMLPIIIIVFGIVLIIVFIGVIVFRKHFCKITKILKKKRKEEMTKKSTLSTISGTLTEDSQNSIGMQHWHGPIAYNNRYVPGWDRENNQHQTSSNNQISQSETSNENKDEDIQFEKNSWEFPRHRLKFFNILGEGAFGQVWRCEATKIDGVDGIQTVAVKTLKENAEETEKNDLLSELHVMKRLEPHVNVVRLLACCTEKEPIFVIMEYVNKGKLQSYLRNSRAERNYGNMHGKSKTLTSSDLTGFMYQVARGMDFLTSRGIIHRDLAARNILITNEHVCKVADFGFARDVITSKIYERKSEGRLPIRWMATESLYDNLFSMKSDIWSFGILMWEIVTLGSTPYPGMAAADVMKYVRDGKRLEKPEHCRRELYNIMYYCWANLPEERPDFQEVVKLLDKLLCTETDYIELERFPDHNYYNMMGLSGEKL